MKKRPRRDIINLLKQHMIDLAPFHLTHLLFVFFFRRREHHTINSEQDNRLCCVTDGRHHTSNTSMFLEVTKRATPIPMKATPMTTNPGMTMPAESMGCHAGSLCCVKAVLSGRFSNSDLCSTILLILLESHNWTDVSLGPTCPHQVNM